MLPWIRPWNAETEENKRKHPPRCSDICRSVVANFSKLHKFVAYFIPLHDSFPRAHQLFPSTSHFRNLFVLFYLEIIDFLLFTPCTSSNYPAKWREKPVTSLINSAFVIRDWIITMGINVSGCFRKKNKGKYFFLTFLRKFLSKMCWKYFFSHSIVRQ